MAQRPGNIQFDRPPGNVHLFRHLLIGKVIRNPKFYGHLAPLWKALKTFQKRISEGFSIPPVGMIRFIQVRKDSVVLGVPVLHPFVLNVPNNHITHRFIKIMAERLYLQTFVPNPERLKYILYHLLAVLRDWNILAGITVQFSRIPTIDRLECALVAAPQQGDKFCVTMIVIRMHGVPTNRVTESLRPFYQMGYALERHNGRTIGSRNGSDRALRGAFAAMKVLKLFIVDYSRQTLFLNFCRFTGKWNQLQKHLEKF